MRWMSRFRDCFEHLVLTLTLLLNFGQLGMAGQIDGETQSLWRLSFCEIIGLVIYYMVYATDIISLFMTKTINYNIFLNTNFLSFRSFYTSFPYHINSESKHYFIPYEFINNSFIKTFYKTVSILLNLTQIIQILSMSSIEQTLRKSRQIDQKFKAFMAGKQQRDKAMEQTMKKIKDTQQTLKNTKQTLTTIDSLYDSITSKFSQAIDSAVKSVQKSVMLNIADPNWKPHHITPKQFVEHLQKHKQIMFLTGAGMSVASGINTFRGANGYWNKQLPKEEKFQKISRPEQILTLHHFENNQKLTWEWLVDFYNIKTAAKLNKGHSSLDAIMREIVNAQKKTILVTQNIDDFHVEAQKAKKQNDKAKTYRIHQIHGNIKKLRCNNCTQLKKQLQFHDFSQHIKHIQSTGVSPFCPKCDYPLRPHIMFFDEFYSQLYNESTTIRNFDKESDMMVVIGTSLQTGLSRELVESAIERGVPVIEINVECEIKRPGTMWMQGKADEILEKLKLQVWKAGL